MNKIYRVIIALSITTFAHAADTSTPESVKGSHNTSDKNLHTVHIYAALPSPAHRAAALRLLHINRKKDDTSSAVHTQLAEPTSDAHARLLVHDGHDGQPGDHTLHNFHRSIMHDGSLYD